MIRRRLRSTKSSFDYRSLEPRHLLATVSFDGTTMNVNLTNSDDALIVSFTADKVVLNSNGVHSSHSRDVASGSIEQILIRGFAGDDVVSVSGGGDAGLQTKFFGGAGDDSFLGRSVFSPTFNGGDGNDFARVASSSQQVVLIGGAGNDVLRAFISTTFRGAYIDGGAGEDRIQGTNSDDIIFGGVGDDFISSLDGKDRISGGLGDDLIFAGDGNDEVFGDDKDGASSIGGKDTIVGDLGEDLINGQGGDDILFGGDKADQLIGGDGDDQIFGQGGDDFLDGEAGDDLLNGGTGEDEAEGRAGNDRLVGGDQDDHLKGGLGNDRVFGFSGNDFVAGGAGNDTLSGGEGDDRFFGEEGIDLVFGGDGADTIHGGVGDDSLFGGAGDDFVIGFDGDDLALGGNGDDTIVGGLGNDRLFGGGGNDEISTGRDPSIFGEDANGESSGNNQMVGGEGHDELIVFGSGNNTFVGGTGADVVSLGNSGSVVDDPVKLGASDYQFVADAVSSRLIGVEALDFRLDVVGSTPVDEALFGFELPPIVERVFVQPIVVANDDGSRRANFLGTPAQEADILKRVDEMYARAGIDVVFLDEVQYNNTFANVGSNVLSRPVSDFQTIIAAGDAAGVGSSDPKVVDMYFVQLVPGFTALESSVPNGRGFVGKSGVVLHLPDDGYDVPAFDLNSREMFARVIAHEIGHNLGLNHSDVPTLLDPEAATRYLNDDQIEVFLDSDISQKI